MYQVRRVQLKFRDGAKRRRRFSPKVLLTTFHVSPWFQKDEPSSRLNKVPPMGAPKAAATPAAAPADTKSRLSLRRAERDGLPEKGPSGSKGSFSLPHLPMFYLGTQEVRAYEGRSLARLAQQQIQFPLRAGHSSRPEFLQVKRPPTH